MLFFSAWAAIYWESDHIYVPLCLSLFCLWQSRHVWRLSRSVWHFETVSTRRLVLHFDPELKEKWDFAVLLKRIEDELDGLAIWFGFSLRRRPVVFLYSSWQRIAHVLQGRFGGVALGDANAILIGDNTNLEEFLRHELAHLFAFRWNAAAPPLLCEGLAVCLQGRHEGRPVDWGARACLGNASLNLSRLLRPSVFHAPSNEDASYRLAGSFTGFLIRRYGWKRYRRLYRTADSVFFRRSFRKVVGVSLEEAERKWRSALMVNESSAMKTLRRRLERDLL
jgi:hypothetical protein